MKKEGIILIIEPDRIIGWDLQLQLEANGYTVFQAQTVKLAEELKNKNLVKAIIVAYDRVKVDDFMGMKELFATSDFCLVGISSGTKAFSEYQNIKFAETFLKPFDTKKIVAFINKNCVVPEYK